MPHKFIDMSWLWSVNISAEVEEREKVKKWCKYFGIGANYRRLTVISGVFMEMLGIFTSFFGAKFFLVLILMLFHACRSAAASLR